MSHPPLKPLIEAAADAIAGHAEHLTELDSAIGDGDHGHNMKRGFEALRGEADVLSEKSAGEALKAAGMKLVMTIGGASGPLMGTFLLSLGKGLGDTIDRAAFNAAFRGACDAVAARGKAEKGQKTMLDVLYPLADALDADAPISDLPRIAQDAADATIPMIATKGRASFLGERSKYHMDPGSQSVALLTSVAADWTGEFS